MPVVKTTEPFKMTVESYSTLPAIMRKTFNGIQHIKCPDGWRPVKFVFVKASQ